MFWTLLRYLSALAGCVTALYGMQGLAYHILRTGADVNDPLLGPVRRPVTMEYRVEGNAISHWLEQGIRDNGNPSAASAHPTVLMLGDSFLEAMQVNDRETMPSLAERQLRQRGWGIRLLNAGHAQRSLADYVALAPGYRKVFHPDWVMVLVRDADFESDAWNSGQRHFVRQGQALVVEGQASDRPVPLPPDRLEAFLVALPYQLELGNLWNLYLAREGAWRARWDNQAPLFEASRRAPEPPLEPRYPLEEELLALSSAYQGRLTLLYLPAFRAPQGRMGSSVQARVGELCRRHGIDYVDLGHEFPRLVEQGVAPFGFPNTRYNSGHLNRHGQAAASSALVRELEALRQRGVL